MSLQQLNISEGFKGKNIFLTGVTGFVGKVLLYKLLKEFGNDLKHIYVLIRSKKGQNPFERFKKQVCDTECFNPLKRQLGGNEAYLDFMKRIVIPIPGDLLEDMLGLSDVDYNMLTDNVNYVIHVAATVNFSEKLNLAVKMNILGALKMLALAKKCKHLEAMIHTSTCYVNWGRDGDETPVMERIYPLSFDPKQMVKYILALHDKHVDEVEEELLRKYKFPNTYCFTKNLTEHLLQQNRGNVPLAIVRPSIIGCALKEPCPGWVDALTAAGVIILTVAIGLLHELHCEGNYIADVVPVDYVANTLIKAAFVTAVHHKNSERKNNNINSINKNDIDLFSNKSNMINTDEFNKHLKLTLPPHDGDSAQATVGTDSSIDNEQQNEYPLVYSANTSGSRNHLRWKMFQRPLEDLWNEGLKHPNSVGKINLTLFSNRYRYLVRYTLLRKVPFFGAKLVSHLPYIGNDERNKLIKKYEKALIRAQRINDIFPPFTTKQWIFDSTNAHSLDGVFDERSSEHFSTDVFDIQWYNYAQLYSWGITKFIMKSENREAPQAPETGAVIYMRANM